MVRSLSGARAFSDCHAASHSLIVSQISKIEMNNETKVQFRKNSLYGCRVCGKELNDKSVRYTV